ncbi:DUF805 domain-containing protein [Acinetobacter sp. LoGeW2-3]|uniref:DUF805 domain-containing protein n=1 Tax=Acinetobacter sp. LoGeW2-3 TaxID=1808001 RepID=UPI00148A4DD0|nr:DUF805 domain-containing protein [Acinetobacter sp. LoGeW2-3]
MNSKDTSPFFSRSPIPSNDNPLSLEGRFGRLSFIGWYAFLHMIFFFASIALSLVSGIFSLTTLSLDNQHFVDALTGLAGLGYLALVIFYLYFYIVIVARRLHDLNKSGWLMLLMLVPVVNIFFIFYLLLAAGTPGPNRFGPVRSAAIWEKILAWLMILLTVLSLFAASSVVSFMMGSGELESPQEAIQKGTEYF